jgi:hypothetical protein
MMRRLLIVEDSFQIQGRGLVVVPGPLMEAFEGPAVVPVELRRPDGTIREAQLSVQHFFATPAPKERRWACVFRDLGRADAPPGTEIWWDGNADRLPSSGRVTGATVEKSGDSRFRSISGQTLLRWTDDVNVPVRVRADQSKSASHPLGEPNASDPPAVIPEFFSRVAVRRQPSERPVSHLWIVAPALGALSREHPFQ